jgi:hypothetical protein
VFDTDYYFINLIIKMRIRVIGHTLKGITKLLESKTPKMFRDPVRSGMVVHTCNASTRETEAEN